MLKWLLPREERFFFLIKGQAENVLAGARALLDLLRNYENVETKAKQIHQIEHQGDNICQSINNSLNTTYLNPIARADIHALASSIDKVIDYIAAGAKRMLIFRLKKPTPEMITLGELIERCAIELCQVVPKLSNPSLSEEI